ncbi:MAG: diguanylate cyclase [Betaproteobacteria bacterium]|nr:diguanylate cyclase [Betaproteobacteria bacterium]
MSSHDLAVARIMHTDLLTCAPNLAVADAALRMKEAHCSSILVVENGQAVGIWTERDAVKMDFSSPQVFEQPIAAVMSTPVRTLTATASVGEAAVVFQTDRIRHLLVVDAQGRQRGIISQTDVVRAQGIEFYVMLRSIESVMEPIGLSVPAERNLSEVIGDMRRRGLDAVLVEESDGTLGILTERDVVSLIGRKSWNLSVGEAASKPLLTLSGSDSVYRASKIFSNKKIRHLGVTDATGKVRGLISYANVLASVAHEYVTELHEALREQQQKLNQFEHRLRLADRFFETMSEALMVTDAAGNIESVNPAFTAITGYELHEVVGQKPSVLRSGRHEATFYSDMWATLTREGRWQGEVWNRRKTGEIYPEWLSISAVRNPQDVVTNYVAIFSDITERKAGEEKVRYLAYHDALTGLPNRTLFMEHVRHALSRARRNRKLVALMFVDLDSFKAINDAFGHDAGDRFLVSIAKTLQAALREDDTVARLGGDEFAAVLEDVADQAAVEKVAAKVLKAISRPVELAGQRVGSAASIGISLYPSDADSVESLLKHADTAMYSAKRDGKGCYRVF